MRVWLLRCFTIAMSAVVVFGCAPAIDTSASDANRALVARFVAAVNARDFDELRTLLTASFTRHCQATPDVTVKNPEDMIAFIKQDNAVFPDGFVTMKQVVVEGDMIGFWAEYTGMQEGQMGPFPPSHKRMTLDFAGVFRVENGKFAELWLTWDNLAGLAQLGHFPPPADEME